MRLFISLFVCMASTACGEAEPTLTAAEAALIYGADDRQELFQLRGDDGLRPAIRAVAAVIPRDLVQNDAEGRPQLTAPTLGSAEELCSGEPFADQPSAAECTAVLIDDNLLATAGHCFAHAWDCQSYLFIFDYVYSQEGAPLKLEASDVYECTRALVQENDAVDGAVFHDFAIIELTRKVVGRTPVLLRASEPLLAEPLSVISTTAGVPLKIDRGARVLQTRSRVDDSFLLDADTFHGSSGAPVLDAQGALLGLLSRGQQDFTLDVEAACYRSTRLAAPELVEQADAAVSSRQQAAEQASSLAPAIVALCARGYPSERLCGITPERVETIRDASVAVATITDAAVTPMPQPAQLDLEPEPAPNLQTQGSGEGCSAARDVTPPLWWTWILAAVGWPRGRRHSKSSQARVRHT